MVDKTTLNINDLLMTAIWWLVYIAALTPSRDILYRDEGAIQGNIATTQNRFQITLTLSRKNGKYLTFDTV